VAQEREVGGRAVQLGARSRGVASTGRTRRLSRLRAPAQRGERLELVGAEKSRRDLRPEIGRDPPPVAPPRNKRARGSGS
jgi:hypothetical protein